MHISRNYEELEILTPSGFKPFSGVSRKKVEQYCEVTFPSGEKLKCTLDHRVRIQDIFVEAQHLSFPRQIVNETTFVYDPINVGQEHEYLIGNIVNHNCVEFLGSSGTLIAGWKLKELVHQTPLMNKDGLALYKQPAAGRSYVCIVDVSRGKGLDYSAFSIFDVTQMPYEQVCTYRNNLISPIDYADIVHRICKSYNNAAVLVEINDIGEQVATSLHFDFEYENVLFTESAGRSGKRITSGFGGNIDKGIRTTKSVKSVGCSILKLMVEQNQLIINDFTTINELSTFSRRGVSYEAESGKNDDMVMGLVLFAWLSDQAYFKEYTNINTLAKLREKTEEDILQELTPFGFFDNGMTHEEMVESPPSRSWMSDETENSFI